MCWTGRNGILGLMTTRGERDSGITCTASEETLGSAKQDNTGGVRGRLGSWSADEVLSMK